MKDAIKSMEDYSAYLESNITVNSMIKSLPKPNLMRGINPLHHQDLLYTARELPKIPNLDHEELVIKNYLEGGWSLVEMYCEFVYELDKELNPKKTIWQRIKEILQNGLR
jgi:hypothetical protein